MSKHIEQTLVVFKPDAVQRGIVGEVAARFEKAGLKIVGMKMLNPSREHYFEHYEKIGSVIERNGQKVYDDNLNYMEMGPVIAMILQGVSAVELVRKMVGSTEPRTALPGTIRGDYAHVSFAQANEAGLGTPNIVHASGDLSEAKLEIALWFTPEEIFDYIGNNEIHTQPKK